MNIATHIARSKNSQGKTQSYQEHAENVSILAESFSIKKFKDLLRIAGKYHDIGKLLEDFQNKLKNNSDRKVPHKHLGALLLMLAQDYLGLLGLSIYMHHHTMENIAESENKLKNAYLALTAEEKDILDFFYENLPNEVNCLSFSSTLDFDTFFALRYITSCLVDADGIDAGHHHGTYTRDTRQYSSFGTLLERLENFKKSLKSKSKINRIRKAFCDQAASHAKDPTGFFLLPIPTGGGKTLTGIEFALRHAIETKKQRIIYVAPYLSIIDQTHSLFCSIFGGENVLGHFSTVDPDHNDLIPERGENWDGPPIILTTNVQFYESLFSNRISKYRKLHRIGNSVVILDEAHTLPYNLTLVTLELLKLYVNETNTSIVISTATNPQFDAPCTTLIHEKRHKEFDRVKWKRLHCGIGTILKKAEKTKCCSIICNTKRVAYESYHALKSRRDDVYLLTSGQAPIDRLSVLKQVQERLRNNQSVVLCSTQVIECGVDISFPIMYREDAPIPSLVQSAGRVNRHGLLGYLGGKFYIFDEASKSTNTLIYGTAISISNSIEKLDDIEEYFSKINLHITNNEQNKAVFEICEELKFEDVSNTYKIIEDEYTTVYAPEARNVDETDPEYYRKIQKYAINIYFKNLNAILNFVEDRNAKLLILRKDAYDSVSGILPLLYDDLTFHGIIV